MVSSSWDYWKHPNTEGLIHMPISTTTFSKGSLWILWLHEAIARQLFPVITIARQWSPPGEFPGPHAAFPTQFPHSPTDIYLYLIHNRKPPRISKRIGTEFRALYHIVAAYSSSRLRMRVSYLHMLWIYLSKNIHLFQYLLDILAGHMAIICTPSPDKPGNGYEEE